MNDTRILFLLVNYFNEKEVVEFISSQLGKHLDNKVQAIIIDNGSYDFKILKELEKKYSSVCIITAKKNMGYFGAANLGLKNYLTTNTEYPDIAIVCNTDISFKTPDFISKLKTVLNEKKFDVLGPDIYSSFLKYHQNPYIINRISLRKIKLYKLVTSYSFFYFLFTLLHFIKTKILKSSLKDKLNEQIETYAIHGSFMVFNKSFFAKGGNLDYPSFLFGEELFVAETSLKLGLRTIYEPSLVIDHFQNTTTGTFKSRKTVKYLHQSYCYLLETFFIKKNK